MGVGISRIMAVLLSLKIILSPDSNKVAPVSAKAGDVNSTEGTKDKYNFASVRKYFRNLMRSNSYSLERKKVKKDQKNPPLPDLVKELFTKNEESEEKWTPRISEKKEILLDENDSPSSVVIKSVTNLQSRLLDESLEEAEAHFEKLVVNKSLEKIEDSSITFSLDEDVMNDSLGELRVSQIDLSELKHDLDLSEDDESDDSSIDSDVVLDYLEKENIA